ncbi:MAG: fibrinogen-like YCDxxxxGGGW domain-containing protein [Candidatus Gracilibacteria bacterium]|nr:fibrinogen-like YCDxxxxGGGW domain-containing protein [Candidatus Gracilibacteria bacterium]
MGIFGLSSALNGINKNSGEVLDNLTWTNISSLTDKIDVSGDNIKLNGKLYVTGNLCDNNGNCLGQCSDVNKHWDKITSACINSVQDCTPEKNNATLATKTWNGVDDYLECTVQTCADGYVVDGKVCKLAKLGTIDNPGESCKHILDNGGSIGNGDYWIDPNGGNTTDKFRVYCDMSGGGWTLALNITQNILQPDLYNTEIGTPSLFSNYMVGIKKLGLNNSSILKFTCKKLNGNRFTFYHRNISNFSSYLIIGGSYSGTIECANNESFSSNRSTTLNNCLPYHTDYHRYYSISGSVYGWANLNASSPYLIRHCDEDPDLEGGYNGRIWIK